MILCPRDSPGKNSGVCYVLLQGIFLAQKSCPPLLWLLCCRQILYLSVTVSTFSPSICHEVVALDAMILVFDCRVLSQLFHSPVSLSSRGSLVEYIMRNAGLDEAQTGIKIARRNINNLRYADDTTLMAEIEGELKSLLMKAKEETEKGLTLNIQKTKIMASGSITSWQTDGKKWKQ